MANIFIHFTCLLVSYTNINFIVVICQNSWYNQKLRQSIYNANSTIDKINTNINQLKNDNELKYFKTIYLLNDQPSAHHYFCKVLSV